METDNDEWGDASESRAREESFPESERERSPRYDGGEDSLASQWEPLEGHFSWDARTPQPRYGVERSSHSSPRGRSAVQPEVCPLEAQWNREINVAIPGWSAVHGQLELMEGQSGQPRWGGAGGARISTNFEKTAMEFIEKGLQPNIETNTWTERAAASLRSDDRQLELEVVDIAVYLMNTRNHYDREQGSPIILVAGQEMLDRVTKKGCPLDTTAETSGMRAADGVISVIQVSTVPIFRYGIVATFKATGLVEIWDMEAKTVPYGGLPEEFATYFRWLWGTDMVVAENSWRKWPKKDGWNNGIWSLVLADYASCTPSMIRGGGPEFINTYQERLRWILAIRHGRLGRPEGKVMEDENQAIPVHPQTEARLQSNQEEREAVLRWEEMKNLIWEGFNWRDPDKDTLHAINQATGEARRDLENEWEMKLRRLDAEVELTPASMAEAEALKTKIANDQQRKWRDGRNKKQSRRNGQESKEHEDQKVLNRDNTRRKCQRLTTIWKADRRKIAGKVGTRAADLRIVLGKPTPSPPNDFYFWTLDDKVAKITCTRNFISEAGRKILFREIDNLETLFSRHITAEPHPLSSPQATCMFGDFGLKRRENGMETRALPWPPTLFAIVEFLRALDLKFRRLNAAKCTYFESGTTVQEWHSEEGTDVEPVSPTVIVFLGEERTLRVRSKPGLDSLQPMVEGKLKSGDLWVMFSQTQGLAEFTIDQGQDICMMLTFGELRRRRM